MKFVKNNWTKAIIVNCLILITIMAFSELVYETNDDYGIALRIVEGYPYVYLINYWLCKILIPIQNFLPGVNVFIYFQIFASFIAFTSFTKIALDYKPSKFIKLITIAGIFLLAGDHYCMMQYTKTSALLIVIGIIVLVDSIIKKRHVGYFVLSAVLLFFGASLRFINVYVAAAFALLFCIFIFACDRKEINFKDYVSPKRIGVYFIAITLLFTIGLLDWSSDNNSIVKEYAKYNSNRAKITDYPVYENYDKLKEEYTNRGFSENDIFMIRYWYQDEKGSASLENMRTINNIYEEHTTKGMQLIKLSAERFFKDLLSNIRNLTRMGIHVIVLVMLAVFGVLIMKPKYVWYIFGVGLLTISLYIYLYCGGRTLYRATYSIDVNALLWILYFYQEGDRSRIEETNSNKLQTWNARITTFVIIACIAIMQRPFYSFVDNVKYKSETQLMPDDVVQYFESNEDKLFIFSNADKELSRYYLTPTVVPEKGFEKNMICMGGWGTGSKFNQDKIKKYGLEDMYADSINNPKVFIVESKNIGRLTEYYNKWYGKNDSTIYFELYDKIEDYKIYQIKKDF